MPALGGGQRGTRLGRGGWRLGTLGETLTGEVGAGILRLLEEGASSAGPSWELMY